MAGADQPASLPLCRLTALASALFLTYAGVVLLWPGQFPSMPPTLFLTALLIGAVVISFRFRGATRVFYAAFASFGFAQISTLALIEDLGARTNGYFHQQTLQLFCDRIHRKPFGSEFNSFASTANVLLIFIVAAIAAVVCRALCLSSRRDKFATETDANP